MNKIIIAGEIYTPFEKVVGGAILIQGEKIADVTREVKFPPWPEAEVIDASDQIAVPGFIDLQINGAGGGDLMEGSYESLALVARTLARFGTTAFLPTIITAPESEILRALDGISAACARIENGATPLGIHLEGPFLSKTKRGTHPPEHLRTPELGLLERAYQASRGKLKIITLAPELDGGLKLISAAAEMGIIPSLGHSEATYEQALRAIEAGARHSVHVFNAMRPFSHRDPGIIAALLNDERISTEIITDGIHVHPAAVKLFTRAKRLDQIVLSTDSISAAGMPDGTYRLGGRYIQVTGGACRDAEGRLAGSSLTQDRALRNLIAWSGLSLREALMTATVNPAKVLGLDSKGILAAGCDADVVLLNSKLEVQKTIIKGRVAYNKKG
jgi:N-acetylglucosamine-6-phosphate deacetylase